MAVSGKKINELEAVTTLTDDSVLPTVIINDATPETTAKKVTTSQLAEYTKAKVLPDQTGQNGKVLTTNGTNVSWQTPASAPVSSVNAKTGEVVLTGEDININSNTSTTIDTAINSKQSNPTITTDTSSSSITISELGYNTVYQFGTIDSLTISALPSDYSSDNKRYEESVIYFTSGSSGTTISLPTGLTWINQEAPTIEGSTKYVISICNGAVISGRY